MAKSKRVRDPRAYFETARGYQAAADRLLLSMESGENLPIRDPTYFLYAHAVELALKACLLSRGLDPASSGSKGHEIGELYRECRSNKLLGKNDPDLEMHNLIALLGTANEHHQYRYPDPPPVGRAIPDTPWTREIVNKVMVEVEIHVSAWAAANHSIPVPTTTKLAFGKPTYTKQPRPTRSGP